MFWVVVATLFVLILSQLVTWWGLYVVAGWIGREIHRQDDRIRRRVERQVADEDSDNIGSLVDTVRAAATENLGGDSGSLQARYPDARKLSDYEEL